MTMSAASERRFLSHEELEMVGPTHYPAVAELDADALREKRAQLRGHRDKALTVARHKQREATGKGGRRAAAASGNVEHAARRKQAFSHALRRVNRQLQRLEHAEALAHTTGGAQRAMALKRRSDLADRPGAGPHARRGMRANPSLRRAMTLQPGKVGRVSAAGKKTQARRDAAG